MRETLIIDPFLYFQNIHSSLLKDENALHFNLFFMFSTKSLLSYIYYLSFFDQNILLLIIIHIEMFFYKYKVKYM